MAISGLWQQRASKDYTGATKWGTGVNPIHTVRDLGRGRVIGTRQNLLPLGEPSDVVAEQLAARDIDYTVEDYVSDQLAGEWFRYQTEHPDWGETTPQFRDSANSAVMGEQGSWGPYFDSNPLDGFPLGGPTGGMQTWLDVDHGETVEQQRAIAVPTPFVSGGWLGKVRGPVAQPESQDPGQPGYQPTINTVPVQGPGIQSSDNSRATDRGTDAARSSITSRTAGMVQKRYGWSFGMGGGPGTPDMRPFQQTVGLKRPWFTRVASMPPEEQHMMNTMEGRVPIARTMPPDPHQGEIEAAGGLDDLAAASDWGY